MIYSQLLHIIVQSRMKYPIYITDDSFFFSQYNVALFKVFFKVMNIFLNHFWVSTCSVNTYVYLKNLG